MPLRRSLPPILAWILFQRLTLIVAIIFLFFPVIALGPARSLLGGLFLLGFWGLASVVLLALTVGRAIVLVTDTATRSGPIRLLPRLPDGRPPDSVDYDGSRRRAVALAWNPDGKAAEFLRRHQETIAVVLALPTILAAYFASVEAPGVASAWVWIKLGAIASGAAVYSGLGYLSGLLQQAFRPPGWPLEPSERRRRSRLERKLAGWEPGRFARALRRAEVRLFLLPSFGVGYVRELNAVERAVERNRREGEAGAAGRSPVVLDRTRRYELLPGHAASHSFTLVTVGLYVVLGIANHPSRGVPWAPALAYVLIVLLMGLWFLSAFSFWADRFRIPVLIFVVAASILSYQLGGSDHYFRLLDAGVGAVANEDDPLEDAADERAFEARLRRDCSEPAVLVAAAGGGITSAAWSTAVLTRLATDRERGGRFLRSLHLVSGVSGGSVGAMFFVDGLTDLDDPPKPLAPEVAAEIRRAATASSLEAVGWGLAYPDLVRSLFSPVLTLLSPWVDRSWALERSWADRLPSRGGRPAAPVPTLGSWRADFLRGSRPAVILNATAVESGQRVRLATIRLREEEHGAVQFWTAYPRHDLAIPTAARLSATFPFVSTAARGRTAEGTRVAAAHVVDGGYFDNSGQLSALELLDGALTRLADEPTCRPRIALVRLEPYDPETRGFDGIEPVDGWTAVTLSPIQTLLAVRSASQLDRNEWEFRIFAERWRRSGFEIVAIPFRLGYVGPLSWRLSRRDLEAIDARAEESMSSEAVRTLWSLFERPVSAPMAAPIDEKAIAFERVLPEPGATAD